MPLTETSATTKHGNVRQEKLNPRELMRARHPDLFSDTSVDIRPHLPKEVFEYHLDTLTNRKQEYEFEHFCRKLAEREICPNLRVQTGPTGGGDSKVDSETYPVASEIAERWWVGEPSGGSERWAFAFSAKKKWMPKLRADVKNIVSTERDYKRIYFFTNQFVSDKNRSKLEDALQNSTGIPIHIFDRASIVEMVYEHGHLAVAIATLGIDGASEEKQRLPGPLDSARSAELEELDKQIVDPSRYQGARYQLVEDCLRGAVLARGLEMPRHEVEGRFAHAARLAQGIGIPNQLMRIAYNRAWTAHWWYEDYDGFIQFYTEVEAHLTHSSEAADIQRLLNLWQLLIAIESHGLASKEIAQSDARREKLTAMLNAVAADTARPNNALQARTSLAFIKVAGAMIAGNLPVLEAIWSELTQIVDDSSVLGLYPVQALADMVHEFGEFADSAAFDVLYEKVVGAMRLRSSDGEAGNAFRERGIQKLQHDRPYEAIRWIGRAEELLVKEEYQDDLVMTLVAGSFAYERAGLLWAARNKILIAAERSFYAFARSGEMQAATLRILQRLAWIELQLGRIPHVLQAMSWASFAATQLNLSEMSKAKYAEEVQMQEAVLGIHFLNLPLNALSGAEKLPDALERLGLTNARLALLYALGHEKRIYSEKYFPKEISKEEFQSFFEQWQDQPAARDIPNHPTLIEAAKTHLRSVILGSEFVIVMPSDPTCLGVAESLLGALEAFLATSDEANLLPHVERTTILIRTSDRSDATLTFGFVSSAGGDAEIVCPAKVEFLTVEEIHGFSKWLRDTVIEIAVSQFMIRDFEAWVERVAGDERAFARAILLGDILTIGRNAFGHQPRVRLSNWFEPDDKIYECIRTEPWRKPKPAVQDQSSSEETQKFGNGPAPTELLDNTRRKHTERQVMSPIDVPLWNQAKWGGTMFGTAEGTLPMLGLIFDDAKAGRAIFAAWRTKFGHEDLQDALRIVIVTGISTQHPAHYAVTIGPSFNLGTNSDTKIFVSVSRILRVTAATSANLEAFLGNYRRSGAYLLVPSSMGTPPRMDMAISVTKRHLHVRPAWEIGENDPDAMVFADDDDPVIPTNVVEAPVKKALEWMRAKRRESK